MRRPVLGGCWEEACFLRLRTQGDFQWHGYPDPVSVETCSCVRTYSHVVSGSVYEADLNLQCGASRHSARNAVCSRSLPCVRRVDAGSTRRPPGQGARCDCPLKPGLQKRLKKRTDCGGKHLGCSWEVNQGLQCGLSGNRVAYQATVRLRTERGTASIGNEGCPVGKTDPT